MFASTMAIGECTSSQPTAGRVYAVMRATGHCRMGQHQVRDARTRAERIAYLRACSL